jgi:hypothetical protein
MKLKTVDFLADQVITKKTIADAQCIDFGLL